MADPKRKRYRLRKLEIDRIDLTPPHGAANPEAWIKFWKSRDQMNDDELVDALDGLTRNEILESLTEIASEMVKHGEATSIEAGRADLWELPGVYEAFQKAADTPPPFNTPIAKSGILLKDAIYEAVKKKAEMQRLIPGQFSRSAEEIMIDDLWLSPQGRALYALATYWPLALMDAEAARGRIGKSAQLGAFQQALDILDAWSR